MLLSPRTLLPTLLLGFTVATSAGLVVGTFDAIADGNASRVDLIRIAIMALVSASVLAQGIGVLRSLPPYRHTVGRLARGRTRREPAADVKWSPLLLDQLSAEELTAAAVHRFAGVRFLTAAAVAGRRVFAVAEGFSLGRAVAPPGGGDVVIEVAPT
jgi:hypothetical protein